MDSIPSDIYQYLSEKLYKLQPDIPSVLRKLDFFLEAHPDLFQLEYLILLAYLNVSPHHDIIKWDFSKAQQSLQEAKDKTEKLCDIIYQNEIESAEIQNGYLFLINNCLHSVILDNLLTRKDKTTCYREWENVKKACTKLSAASIHAVLAFFLFIFDEDCLEELALDHINKALKFSDHLKNCHWQYLKVRILQKLDASILKLVPKRCDKNISTDKLKLINELTKHKIYTEWAKVALHVTATSNDVSVQTTLPDGIKTTTNISLLKAKHCIEQREYKDAYRLLMAAPEKCDEVLFYLGHALKCSINHKSRDSLPTVTCTSEGTRKEMEEALSLFDRSIEVDVTNFGSLLQRAILLAELGKCSESLKEFQITDIMLKRRELTFARLVFLVELLKLTDYLSLSDELLLDCMLSIVIICQDKYSVTGFGEEIFLTNYAKDAVHIVLEKLEIMHSRDKTNVNIAKTSGLIFLKLQNFKNSKQIYRVLYTKGKLVNDSEVILGLGKSYIGLQEKENVKALIKTLKLDEVMATLGDQIYQMMMSKFDKEKEGEGKDQRNRRQQRSNSFSSSSTCYQISAPRRRSSIHVGSQPIQTPITGKRRDVTLLSEVAQRYLNSQTVREEENQPSHKDNDQLKDLHPTDAPDNSKQLIRNVEAPPTIASDKFLSEVAEIIASKRKEFARECLDLTEPEVLTFESDNQSDCKESTYQMLYKWKERTGSGATHRELLKIMKEFGKFPADTICKINDLINTSNMAEC